MKQSHDPTPVVDFDLDATEHPIITLKVDAGAGTIMIMAEVVRRRDGLELHGVHLHSDVGANAFGAPRLRRLAKALMELFDVDFVVVAGTRRIGRAVPGNRTRFLRFTRKASP